MSTTESAMEWKDGDTTCRGFYYTPIDRAGDLPVILMCPAWDGIGEEIKEKADRLATEGGYITVILDVLGEGQFKTDFAELEATLTPFMTDRAMLLRRLEAGLAAAKNIPNADTKRMAIMGYCFGGTCALDLARSSNKSIKAVLSFHGGLAGNGLEQEEPITAPVLVMHGHDDPMVPPEQVRAFQDEMTGRLADWQLHAYGHTVHAFTRPDANNPAVGAVYSQAADRRSWQSMLDFLDQEL
jgi:dienelactone hydrolase